MKWDAMLFSTCCKCDLSAVACCHRLRYQKRFGNLVMQKSSNERYQRKSLRGTQAVFTPIGILHYCAAALNNFQS
jgi:hypothetical protein